MCQPLLENGSSKRFLFATWISSLRPYFSMRFFKHSHALVMIRLWQLLIIWERPEGKSLLPFFLSLFSHIKFDITIWLNLMRSGGRENCGWLLGVGSNIKVIGYDCKSFFILQFRSLFFTEKNMLIVPLFGNS